jgi:hypothetical protein
MADLFEIKEAEERVILIAVSVNEEEDTAASLDELEELVKTAGAFTESRADSSWNLSGKRKDRRGKGADLGTGSYRRCL